MGIRNEIIYVATGFYGQHEPEIRIHVLARCTGLSRMDLSSSMLLFDSPTSRRRAVGLESHQSLKMVLSEYEEGFQRRPELSQGSRGVFWGGVSITLVTSLRDGYPQDGKPFNIDEAIQSPENDSLSAKDLMKCKVTLIVHDKHRSNLCSRFFF